MLNKTIIRLAIIYATKQINLYMQLHDKSPADPERFYSEGAISALQDVTAFLNVLMQSIEGDDK